MPILILCACGRSLRVKDEFAGKKVRCPSCSQVLTAPRAADEGSDEEALKFLLEESPADQPPARSPQVDHSMTADEPPSPPTSPLKSPEPSRYQQEAKPRPKRPRSSREEDDDSRTSFAVNPAIVTGLLMMVGAAVWFFVGLAAGYIFFYPPILFVFGIVSIIKGFTGQD